MPPWLAFSIVASVAVTLVLDVALRVFPGARLRLHDALRRAVERADRPTRARRPGGARGLPVEGDARRFPGADAAST